MRPSGAHDARRCAPPVCRLIERIEGRPALRRGGHQKPPALGLDQGQRLPRSQRDALQQLQPRPRARRTAQPLSNGSSNQPASPPGGGVQCAAPAFPSCFIPGLSLFSIPRRSRPASPLFLETAPARSSQPGYPHRQLRIDDLELAPGQLHLARGQRHILAVSPLRLDHLPRLQSQQIAHPELAHRNRSPPAPPAAAPPAR